MPSPAPVCQIKVTLTGTHPPIWRRLLVPADMTLERLHKVLQIAFGWQDGHLHGFRVGHQNFGPSDPIDIGFGGPGTMSEKKIFVGDVLGVKGAKAVYTYDFGDDWEHAIVVEKAFSPDPELSYPLCIAGKLHAPPEDCGGVPGFYNFLETLSDPKHPDHKDMREWFGGDFDPLAFSVDEVNVGLARLRRRVRR